MKLESLLKKYSRLVNKIVDGDTDAERKAEAIEPEIESLLASAKQGYGDAFVAPYEKEYSDLRNMIYF